MLAVFRHALRRRRSSLIWWSFGIIGMEGLLAVAYPTVRDNAALDKTFAGLPPSVQTLLALRGGATLTSPVGYLNSQFYANILPVMLLIFAIGFAAWAIAGDEAAGTLELLVANPVSRVRTALERAGALVALLAALGAIAAIALVAMAPPSGLTRGLPPGRIFAATAATGFLALAYAAVAFLVGAATGRRSWAIAAAASIAVAQFVVEGLAVQVQGLRPVRLVSPWHWFLGGDTLSNGLVWRAWLLPLLTSAVLITIGTSLFSKRDLRSS
ncbi:MAG: ABC transporter permease subunit [Candidatus Dormibacteria bacterium]